MSDNTTERTSTNMSSDGRYFLYLKLQQKFQSVPLEWKLNTSKWYDQALIYNS